MLEGHCHCGRVHWSLRLTPESVTACSCTVCRRYGVLWAYGYFEQDISVRGETRGYQRSDGRTLTFHFCGHCGCVTHYIATQPDGEGRRWSAVNARLAEPGAIEHLPIDHFDGLESWADLPRDGRTVKDLWF